jgi:Domain of unknown function (DUF4190)
MNVGASGDRDPAPVEPTPLDPTRLDQTLSDPTLSDPTLWYEPMPPVYPGYAAYPAQYPPSYPDLGSGPSPAGYPPPVRPSPVYPSPVYPSHASHPPYGYPAARRTNSFAIAALVLSFVFWPAGIVLGHVARRQIARSGESGGGLATAALVVAYLHFAFTALLIVVGVAGSG